MNPLPQARPLFRIDPLPKLAALPDGPFDRIDIRYPLIPPYAYVHLHWDHPNKELLYTLEEPELSEDEHYVLNLLEDGIKELINISFIAVKEGEQVITYLEKNVQALLEELRIKITDESYQKVMYYIYRDFVGLGKIEPLLNDYFIEDIECNGSNLPVYIVHRKYRNLRTNLTYKDNEELRDFVERLAQKAGKYISYANPLLDGSLSDGSVDYEESLIYKENGIVKVSKIGVLVDKFYSNKESNNPISVENLEVPAFDKEKLKINWRKVDYVYRHRNDEDLYEIKLEYGRKIKLTRHHSIFILTREGIKAKRTEDIKKDDFVAVPLMIPENDAIREISVAKELSATKYVKKLIIDNVPSNLFELKRKEIYSYLEENYKLPNQAYYEHKKKRILPLKLYTLLEEKQLRECKIRPTSAVGIPTFINVDEDFMRFLGLYAAEGWLSSISNVYSVYFCFNKNEQNLVENIRESAKNCFGLTIYVEPEDKNAVKVKVNSYALWILLNDVLNISKGASKKRIPGLVFNVNRKLQQEFLKYWSLGDYGSTASKDLSNDISYLSLFNHDIAPFYYRERESTFDKTRKTISHEYYTNFFVRDVNNTHTTMIPMIQFNPLNTINIEFSNKRINRVRLKNLMDNAKLKIQRSHPAFIYEWSKKGFFIDQKPTEKFEKLLEEFETVEKIINSDLGFFRINSITRVKSSSEFVYDLSVKNDENFISGSGGICCHNSRVNATFTQDISSLGPTFTIRKFTKTPWTPIHLIHLKTASPQILAYLWLLIEYERNIMIVGATAAGKTTFLNGLAFFIPPQARIVTIEDTRELALFHSNWLPSVARAGVGLANLVGQKHGEVTLFDLLKESFRQNPDYVIVGEIRGPEAYVLFQGMNSGHPSLGTMHANSVETMVRRLSTPPINLPGSLVESLDAVCVMIQVKIAGQSSRRIGELAEVVMIDDTTKKTKTNTPYLWDPNTDSFMIKDKPLTLVKIQKEHGVPLSVLERELELRTKLLIRMYQLGIFSPQQVHAIINEYYKDPAAVINRFRLV